LSAFGYLFAVHLMLTLSLGRYAEFDRKLVEVHERIILMNCYMDQIKKGRRSKPNVKIPCTMEEAERLLRAAKALYPKIAPTIARDIARARKAIPE
jgi:hypothetical protein